MITVMLVILAAANITFIAWATAADGSFPSSTWGNSRTSDRWSRDGSAAPETGLPRHGQPQQDPRVADGCGGEDARSAGALHLPVPGAFASAARSLASRR